MYYYASPNLISPQTGQELAPASKNASEPVVVAS
jgi:hypothetical protein